MDRLIYRWFNDGDRVGIDYGNTTCNSSDRYLSKILPSRAYQSLDDISLSDEDYEARLMDNHVGVYEYLLEEGKVYFDIQNVEDSREPNRDDSLREAEWYRDEYGDEEDY